MITFLIIALIIVSVFLVMIILVQRGRGGGLAGAFGSGGGSSSAFGTKTGDVFTTLTVVTFVVFVLLSISLSFQFKYTTLPLKAPKLLEPDSAKVTETSAELKWEDDAYTEKGYRVYRRSEGKDLVKVKDLGTDTYAFTDTGLEKGTIYSYEVRSWNDAGEVPSNVEMVITKGEPKMPATTSMAVEAPGTGSRPAGTAASNPATGSMPAVIPIPPATTAASTTAPATTSATTTNSTTTKP